MAHENWHIIQRQQIEVLVPRRYNALAVQQRLDALMSEQVLPRLEPVFDRLAGPEAWVEFGRLEVDAVCLPPDAPDAVWGERLFQACVQALETQLEQKSGEEPVSGAQSMLEALAVFLERGRLPWWAVGFDLEANLQREIPRQAPAILALLGTERARQRWVRQFGQATQLLLLKTLRPDPLPLTPAQWEGLAGGDLPGATARYIYWETLWEAARQNAGFPGNWIATLARQMAAAPGGVADLPAFARKISQSRQLPAAVKAQLLAVWLPPTPEDLMRLYEEIEQEALRQPGNDWLEGLIRQTLGSIPGPEALEQLRQNIRRSTRLSLEVQDHLLTVFAQIQGETTGPGKQQPAPSTDPVLSLKKPANAAPPPDAAGLFVPLAGIVLIHPFLPAFLERLVLLDGEQFRHAAAQERAVHLFYFLATGLQHPREDELTLLKLLAGMPPEQPVARELLLRKTEKNEAQRLLKAVIGAWKTLEDNTPDDLRGSFLVREGKLQHGDMGWKLTVEQKAYDVLLSQLPWGISPILHSWMGEMIWVDWV